MLEKTSKRLLDSKESRLVNSKGNQPWIFIGRTDAEAEAPILRQPDVKSQLTWRDPWGWKRLRAGEGGDGGWEGWMASPTPWTWVWASSGRWWRTGKPGVLRSMGSQSLAQLSEWMTTTIYFNYLHQNTKCFVFIITETTLLVCYFKHLLVTWWLNFM